jgi:predicted phosphodiesterase
MTRTALIADIHGNTPALRCVLDDVRAQGCQQLFMLGDIVNGLDPCGCIDLLLEWPQVAGLKGNAELYLVTPNLEQFALREQPTFAELIQLVAWWRGELRPDQIAWVDALPETIRWGSSFLVHDSPIDRLFPHEHWNAAIAPEHQEFFYHSHGIPKDLRAGENPRILDWMRQEGISEIFCGHTHDPFCQSAGNLRVCNVGSVGLPLDGDPRAGWVLIEDHPTGQRQISIRRLEYPIDETIAMVDATPEYPGFARPGRQEAYRTMLRNGRYWKTSS